MPTLSWANLVKRSLEIVPGFISWTIILAPIALSVRYPALVAYFVLSFDFYWLCKAINLAWGLSIAHRRVLRVMNTDWLYRCRTLENLPGTRQDLTDEVESLERQLANPKGAWFTDNPKDKKELSDRLKNARRELKVIENLIAEGTTGDWREIYHLVLIPTYKENLDKLRLTVKSIVRANFPLDRIFIAIITRETDTEGRKNIAILEKEFGAKVAGFFHILDPLEPGIVVGKSAAMAYGGRWIKKKMEELGLDPAKVIVSDNDADFRFHPQYFAYLTFKYVTDPNSKFQIYQSIPMFHNNLWEVSLPARIVASGCTNLQMSRVTTPEKLINFSSYATSLKLIHEVGYWAADAIPEDSRFYYKSFFTYGDKFKVLPLYIPIYGDAVKAKSYTRSLVGQYTQIRRWAWGVTDIPFVIEQCIRHKEIPLRSRASKIFVLFTDHINWAVAPFILLFGSNLPLLLNENFRMTTLGQNLGLFSASILTVALFGLTIMIYVEDKFVPPRPKSWNKFQYAMSYLQWFFVPIVGIFFSNLPALDAQTRLMAGRYLEYRVTEKE